MICISKTCRQLLVKKIIKFKASQLWNQLPNEIKKLNLKVYLNPGSKFTYIINYILNDYDQ